ncbi:hypothetical protein B296_00046335 [Ensete ventricosum]|uniref:Uncharacterized protein n=1 Tax=Ensete ventricosum TaxID=4639 RepID=A0A426XE81_ENSVE|nr:hypothetical protein B296_00046335 [Ensete ventricosum]
MGKGGEVSEDGAKVEEENMAAWLVAVNTLKIQPFRLPPLGLASLPLLDCFYGCWSCLDTRLVEITDQNRNFQGLTTFG